jgi:hypothetical protein
MYDKFTNSKKEQFEQLLRDGVPPTLIMFEFGISKEQMKILMYNVQNNNNHYYYPKYNMESYASINGIDNEYDAKAKAAHKKMEEMRKKYRKLYFDSENNNTLPKATKKQSEKKHKVIDNINDNATLPKATQNQSEQIDNVISIIEADIKKVENGSRKEKTFIVKEIENNVNGILGYNFSMTQICQLTHLLQSEKLNYARYSRAIGESIYKIREKTI